MLENEDSYTANFSCEWHRYLHLTIHELLSDLDLSCNSFKNVCAGKSNQGVMNSVHTRETFSVSLAVFMTRIILVDIQSYAS